MLLICISILSFARVASPVCVCDVTTGCDVLCCCDPECLADDKISFTCDTSVIITSTENTVCVSNKILSKVRPDNSFTYTSDDQKTCMSSSETAESTSEIKSVVMKSSSIDTPSSATPTYTTTFGNGTSFVVDSKNHLKLNDLIYYQTGDKGFYRPLTLPAGLRGSCVQDSVTFLRNTTSFCSLKITEELCGSKSKIDAFAFKGLKLIANYRASLKTNIETTIECFSDNDATKTCTQPGKTRDGSCNNVLTKIELVITHSSSDGLSSAVFNLYTAEVIYNTISTLTTTVSYQSKHQQYPNPPQAIQRYRRRENMKFIIENEVSTFSPYQGDSDCSTLPINFGTSYIASCTKTLSAHQILCSELAETLTSSLPTALGKYSNSDLSKPGDWLDTTWGIATELSCNATPASAVMVIKYQSIGSRLDPETEIVSITTSISTVDLEALQKLFPLNDKAIFYFAVQFVSLDAESGLDEDVLSRLADTFPNYSVPINMLFGAVAIFVVLGLSIVVMDQGKPNI